MSGEASRAAGAKGRAEEHGSLRQERDTESYQGTTRPSTNTQPKTNPLLDNLYNDTMAPGKKRKRNADADRPEKKVKTEAPRKMFEVPGRIPMSALNTLKSSNWKANATNNANASSTSPPTTTALPAPPNVYADPRRTNTEHKKRKRSESGLSEEGSVKKPRKEESSEPEEKSVSIKKEAAKSAPKKPATAASKPAAPSKRPPWTCDLCGAVQASSSNKRRHQDSDTCKRIAHERKFGTKKPSPPTEEKNTKAEPQDETNESSPASKKSAPPSKSSRSRGDSTSTKRTSISSRPEEVNTKTKSARIKTTPTEMVEESTMSAPTMMPIGLNNSRGVATSAQNAALQLLYETLTDEEIELLCQGDEPNMFNLKPEELLKYDSEWRAKKRNMFDIKLKEAKETIMKLVLAPRDDEEHHDPNGEKKPAIPIAPYIGQFFKKMREAEKNEKGEDGERVEITAMMAQTVFALSGKKFLETMDEEGVDLKTALEGRKYLEVFEDNQNESAGEYLTNLIEALGREHPFILEKFKLKTTYFGDCDQEDCDGKHQEVKQQFSLTATVPAEAYDLAIGDDDDEYEVEVKHSTNYLIQKAIGYHAFSQISCPKIQNNGDPCDGEIKVKTCIIQYPDFLLVPLEREDAEAPLHTVNLMSFIVDEQKYRMTGMVQKDGRTGHNKAFREVEKKWWKLSDENVTSATPAQLQDRGSIMCVLMLLQKI